MTCLQGVIAVLRLRLCVFQAKTKARDAGLSISFICHDIETASFPEQSFDCILCSNGMAYLQHPQATLQKFRAWLAIGGVLCFNNPQASAAPMPLIQNFHSTPPVAICSMLCNLNAEMYAAAIACSAVSHSQCSSQVVKDCACKLPAWKDTCADTLRVNTSSGIRLSCNPILSRT